MHTKEEDFQNYLSRYSDLRNESPDVLKKLRHAFEDAWSPDPRMLLQTIRDEYNDAMQSGLSSDEAFSCAMEVAQQSLEEKTLDCQKCGKVLPLNEMYSVDACSETCQNGILAGNAE